ncbi:MAG: hypothetical protein L3J86_05210, partial [Thermoplasmata archaeon]|nr:hypothetical protein [Thermoplasmata archaeon]
HQLRIELRRDRDVRMTAGLVRPGLALTGPGTRKLLRRLGRLHDLEVLDRVLLPTGPQGRRLRRDFHRREVSLRLRLARDLARPHWARQLTQKAL